MKCSALNVDFNGVRFDPLGLRSPPYERIKFGYPVENVRFLLLSTNLARKWNKKNMGFKWFVCYFRLRRTLRVNFRLNILEIDQDNLRTKLNWCCGASLWALAQISCLIRRRQPAKALRIETWRCGNWRQGIGCPPPQPTRESGERASWYEW